MIVKYNIFLIFHLNQLPISILGDYKHLINIWLHFPEFNKHTIVIKINYSIIPKIIKNQMIIEKKRSACKLINLIA